MSLITEWSETVTVSGSGSITQDIPVFDAPARGRVAGVIIRADGLVTNLNTIWLVHTPATALIGGPPADEYVFGEGGPLALAASATANSGRTRIDVPPAFHRGLGVVIDVTGSGVWVVTITLEITALEGTDLNATELNS